MKTPIHILLDRFMVLEISVTICLMIALFRLIDWMIESPYEDLSDWHLAPITATLPALVAGMFKIIELIINKSKGG
jgi:hypothetical protein